MKADITISQVYWNKGLSNFFFRDQALNTLDEFIHKAKIGAEDALDELETMTENMDIDNVEECFYSMSLDEFRMSSASSLTRTIAKKMNNNKGRTSGPQTNKIYGNTNEKQHRTSRD